ncbi:ROK family protein [Cohnella endophytica]|uniref:ROK family protein n=1 Tax=Cohnella endophytica TaxID=2419778 RepID=A0A494XN32_9BACL|nr:ROK family protein [Cohnella endophytica]RKP48953.1 ROK family protein [Cohnella endophytica]
MERNLILAYDVGGTQIKAAVVIGGTILEETISHYDSHADRSAEEIVAHFADIAVDLLSKAGEEPPLIGGIGMAFPGPFDYDAGISFIRGLSKFEALYGIPFGERLEEAVRSHGMLAPRLASSFGIRFGNDAALFGLGEAGYGEARRCNRAVCLTIGTGLGSCFLENGRLVLDRADVPDQGWLYPVSYQGKIADDWISRRGILQLASEMRLGQEGLDVKDYAKAALTGDRLAANLFETFGTRMAEILAPSFRVFKPDRIVIGGQISKSGTLFVPAFEKELEKAGIKADVKLSGNTLYSTFMGIYDFVLS